MVGRRIDDISMPGCAYKTSDYELDLGLLYRLK